MIEAINTGDGETLKEGITDLRGEIQQNQKVCTTTNRRIN